MTSAQFPKIIYCILTHVHLWYGSTQIEYSRQKNGTTSMKTVIYIERHNFCLNDLRTITKSNRTKIQTYKVEEQTFGTPCIF